MIQVCDPNGAQQVVGAISGSGTVNYLVRWSAALAQQNANIIDGVTAGPLTILKTGSTARGATFPDFDIEVQSTPEVINGSWTARNHAEYTVIATGTATDPTPVNGHYFGTIVHAGTATIGSVAYSTPGARVLRLRHAGSWNNYVYPHLDAAWTWTQQQTIDFGTGSLPAALGSGSRALAFGAADATQNVIEFFGYNNVAMAFRRRVAGGTRATPTAVPDGLAFGYDIAAGYDGATWQNNAGFVGFVADGLWSGTNRGVRFVWHGTPNGSTAVAEWMRLQNGALSVAVNTTSTSTTTGSILSAGGLGVVGQTTTAQIAVTATTDSSTGIINALANPTGFIRLTGAAPDVRGITNPGASACRRVALYCVNATTLTHEGGTASAADRITSDTGANIAVAAGKTVELIYDTVSSRWRPVRF